MDSSVPLLEFNNQGDIDLIQSSTIITDDRTISSNCHCSLSRYIIHQISLVIFVFIYLICGGLFFSYIESQYYLKKDVERKELISETYDNIRSLAVQLLNEQLNENFENAYRQWRWQDEKFSNYISLNPERAKLLDNRTEYELKTLSIRLAMRKVAVDKFVYKWTYSTAILYAATLVTTIGYGNISPKTAFGKILTVICKIFHLIFFSNNFILIRCFNRNSNRCFMVEISRRIISINRHEILSTFRTMFSTKKSTI